MRCAALIAAQILILAGCTAEQVLPPPTGPCADGGWGFITEPDTAVFVGEGGDDAGAGTQDAPLGSLDEALVRTRSGAASGIALLPGAIVSALVLQALTPDNASDSGLRIQGCGPGETSLEAADEEPAINAAGVLDLSLAGFSIQWGDRSLLLWQGASVTVESVHVSSAQRVGILIDGAFTDVSLTDVEVHEVAAVEDVNGWGVAIQGTDAPVEIRGGGIWNATSIGLFVHDSGLDIADFTVDGTAERPSDELLGRGIHLQSTRGGTIENTTLSNNRDAGLFGWRPFGGVDLHYLDVTGTQGGYSDGAEETGDGIVLTDSSSPLDAGEFASTMLGCGIQSSNRVGVLVEGVNLDASGTTGTNGEMGPSETALIFRQAGAEVTGSDNTADLVLDVDNEPTFEALDVLRVEIDGSEVVPGS